VEKNATYCLQDKSQQILENEVVAQIMPYVSHNSLVMQAVSKETSDQHGIPNSKDTSECQNDNKDEVDVEAIPPFPSKSIEISPHYAEEALVVESCVGSSIIPNKSCFSHQNVSISMKTAAEIHKEDQFSQDLPMRALEGCETSKVHATGETRNASMRSYRKESVQSKVKTSPGSGVPLIWSKPTEIGILRNELKKYDIDFSLQIPAATAIKVNCQADIHQNSVRNQPITEEKGLHPQSKADTTLNTEDKGKNGESLQYDKKIHPSLNDFKSHSNLIKDVDNQICVETKPNKRDCELIPTETGLLPPPKATCHEGMQLQKENLSELNKAGSEAEVEGIIIKATSVKQSSTILQKLMSFFSRMAGSNYASKHQAVNQMLDEYDFFDDVSDDGSQISGYSLGSDIYLRRIRELEGHNGRQDRSQLQELIQLCQSGDLLCRYDRYLLYKKRL